MYYKHLTLLLIFLILPQTYSQSLTGMTGLYSIPIADIYDDGMISTGANFINKKYIEYAKGEKDILNVFVSINYLPFIELGFRVTRQLKYEGKSHTVDRMFNLKVRVIEENKYLPNIAIGFNNPYSTELSANHFNSTFIVLTKNISLNEAINNIGITIGYGSNIIKAADYQFIGLFGGVSFTVLKYFELLLENDAERFNGAVRLTLFKHIKVMAGLMNFKDFSGGLSFSVVL